MSNTVFDQMMLHYATQTKEDKKNALHEVMQQVALAGLYRAGFFDKAAFYGGTCLRIFHALPRFSEDLDLSETPIHETFIFSKKERQDLPSLPKPKMRHFLLLKFILIQSRI
jgi:predicted nucleotidyltransferase component of viral defense system